MKHLVFSVLVGMAIYSQWLWAMGACEADREKFCKDVKPGGGKIMQCMKEHEGELSAECKAAQGKFKESMKSLHEKCHEDVEKLCAGVEKGHGNIAKCLKEHKDQLSAGCKEKVHEMKEERQEHKKK